MQLRPLPTTMMTFLTLALLSAGCSKKDPTIVPVNPTRPADTQPQVGEGANNPAPTAAPGIATTTPAPIGSFPTTPTANLRQASRPREDVSPRGTFGFDVRKWVERNHLVSSDEAIAIVRLTDTAIAPGYRRILDGEGRLVGIAGARLIQQSTGREAVIPITIRNGGGAELQTQAYVSVVKPYIKFSSRYDTFVIAAEPGPIEFNLTRLQARDALFASDEAVVLQNFRSNLPLARCLPVLSASGAEIGIRCDKGALDPKINYQVSLQAGTPEGATDRKSFDVRIKKGSPGPDEIEP